MVIPDKSPRALFRELFPSDGLPESHPVDGTAVEEPKDTTQFLFIGYLLLREESDAARSDSSLSNPAQPEQKQSLADNIRRLMRLVAHPVAIVTSTIVSDDSPVDQHYRGATVSSFNTVTLKPEPVVSFNIKRQSATFEAIQSSGKFNVHLLANSKYTGSLAETFARGNEGRPFHDENGELEWFVEQSPATSGLSMENVNTAHDRSMPPSFRFDVPIEKATGSLTRFRLQCRFLREKTVEIGDHVVVFGQVAQAIHKFRKLASDESRQLCLVYVAGGYANVKRLNGMAQEEE